MNDDDLPNPHAEVHSYFEQCRLICKKFHKFQ